MKPVRADFDRWAAGLPPGQAQKLADLAASVAARPDIGGTNGDYAARKALLDAAAALGFVRQDGRPQGRALAKGRG